MTGANDTDWDDLRFFLAVSREGSASRAGAKLGVNHTTVARRISALEDRLGARLFDRSVEGYEMTQSAEDMYAHALAIEERVLAIDREIAGQDRELKGPLKLTASHDVASRLLAPYLGAFREAYPGIDLELLTTTGLVDLAAREADIALRLTAKPPDFLVGRRVMPLRHGVYASPNYLREPCETERVVLFRGDTGTPEWVRNHFPDAEVTLRVDDVTTMLAAVREGAGLARMPCYIGGSEPAVDRYQSHLHQS